MNQESTHLQQQDIHYVSINLLTASVELLQYISGIQERKRIIVA